MKTWTLRIAAAGVLCVLAGCDERPEEPAIVVSTDGQVAFGGDEKACLTQAYVRNADADEDDETYVWMVDAPEGGCMHFPLVFGTTPEGANDMSGSGQLAEDTRYEFEAGSADRRYVTAFEPQASNGIFYVRDRQGNWVDIRRAEQ